MDFSNLVGFASVEEDAFGGGGLSSVNVGHDTNVAVHGQFYLAEGGGGGGLEVDILGYHGFREDDERLMTCIIERT